MESKKGLIVVILFVFLSGVFGVGGVILGSKFANSKNKLDVNEHEDKEDVNNEDNDEKNDLYYN